MNCSECGSDCTMKPIPLSDIKREFVDKGLAGGLTMEEIGFPIDGSVKYFECFCKECEDTSLIAIPVRPHSRT